MKNIYRFSRKQVQQKLPWAYKRKIYFKFIIAGGTAALVSLTILFILTDILKIYYLVSTTIAFICAYFVSFFLQKFWTFRDNNRDRMASQMSIYFIVGIINLGVNDLGMYLLVDKVNLYHIIAQVITGGIIAISSFLIYRFVIFRKRKIKKLKNEPRILIATGIFPPDIGGPATMLEALARKLEKANFNVKILTYANQPAINENSSLDLYRVYKTKIKIFNHLRYFIKLFFLSLTADLIYVTDTYSVGRYVCVMKKILCKKYIVRFAGDSAWETALINNWTEDNLIEFEEKRYNEAIERLKGKRRRILRNADGVIAVSNFMAKHALKIGIPKKKVRTIYNSIGFLKYTIDSELGNRIKINNNRVILAGGRLIPLKGIDKLIEVFNLIKNDNEFSDTKLIILGDGPDRSRLESLARKSNYTKDIIFVGNIPINNVFSYYQLASVFIINSICESFSHMLIEALSLAKPVIATNCGGPAEIVENEKTGLLVNYGDINQLSRAIRRILTEEKWHGEEFENKCKDSIARFSWEKNVENTIKLINDIINE